MVAAFEVLSDPQKRGDYDQLLSEMGGSDGGSNARRFEEDRAPRLVKREPSLAIHQRFRLSRCRNPVFRSFVRPEKVSGRQGITARSCAGRSRRTEMPFAL